MTQIVIKNQQEIELMRESGRLLARVFAALDDYIEAGLTTLQVNDFVENYIVGELNSRPASKGQYGFQYVLNPSINDKIYTDYIVLIDF